MVPAYVARFRLSVTVGDLESPRFAIRLEHVRAERLAGRNGAAKRGHRTQLAPRSEQAVLRWRLAQDGHALPLTKGKALRGIEPCVAEERRSAREPGCYEHVSGRFRPA